MHTKDDRAADETELVRLVLAIAQIDTWNRIAIAFRAEPEQDQPQTHGKG